MIQVNPEAVSEQERGLLLRAQAAAGVASRAAEGTSAAGLSPSLLGQLSTLSTSSASTSSGSRQNQGGGGQAAGPPSADGGGDGGRRRAPMIQELQPQGVGNVDAKGESAEPGGRIVSTVSGDAASSSIQVSWG